MTLIMRVNEQRRIKPVCIGSPISTGAAPILFQTEVTVNPPKQHAHTEGVEGMDEVTGEQEPFNDFLV